MKMSQPRHRYRTRSSVLRQTTSDEANDVDGTSVSHTSTASLTDSDNSGQPTAMEYECSGSSVEASLSQSTKTTSSSFERRFELLSSANTSRYGEISSNTPAIAPNATVIRSRSPIIASSTRLIRPRSPVIAPSTRLIRSRSPIIVPSIQLNRPRSPVIAPSTRLIRSRSPIIAPSTQLNRPRSPVIAPSTRLIRSRSPIIAPSTQLNRPRSPVHVPSTQLIRPRSPVIAPYAPLTAPNAPVIAPNALVTAPNAPVTAPNALVNVPNATLYVPDLFNSSTLPTLQPFRGFTRRTRLPSLDFTLCARLRAQSGIHSRCPVHHDRTAGGPAHQHHTADVPIVTIDLSDEDEDANVNRPLQNELVGSSQNAEPIVISSDSESEGEDEFSREVEFEVRRRVNNDFEPYGVPNPRNFSDHVAHVAHLMNLVRDYISERGDVNNQSVGIRESERCMPEVAIVERIQNGRVIKELGYCYVCMEITANVWLDPCKHYVFCGACMEKLDVWRCPICRASIDLLTVYV